MSLNNPKRTNNTMDLCSKKVSELNVRLPRRDISSYINGIDFAIWRAYVDESLLMNENLIEKKELGYGAKIPLSETSFGYLNEMSNEMKLNKSEIIRRCLVWLSKQATYPKFYK